MTLEIHRCADRWWVRVVADDGQTLARSAQSWPDRADATALARVLGLRPPSPDRVHVLASDEGRWYVLVQDYDGTRLLYSEPRTRRAAAEQDRQRLVDGLAEVGEAVVAHDGAAGSG